MSTNEMSKITAIGGLILFGISYIRLRKTRRDIEKTHRVMNESLRIIERNNKEMMDFLSKPRIENGEDFEKFLEDTEKWIDEMYTDDEES